MGLHPSSLVHTLGVTQPTTFQPTKASGMPASRLFNATRPLLSCTCIIGAFKPEMQPRCAVRAIFRCRSGAALPSPLPRFCCLGYWPDIDNNVHWCSSRAEEPAKQVLTIASRATGPDTVSASSIRQEVMPLTVCPSSVVVLPGVGTLPVQRWHSEDAGQCWPRLIDEPDQDEICIYTYENGLAVDGLLSWKKIEEEGSEFLGALEHLIQSQNVCGPRPRIITSY